MTKALRVVDWNKHFENNRTRELVQMRWVPFQNSFDGDGFISLLEDHEDGLAHFGCWVLIVEVASTCTPRGTLLRSKGKPPHDAESLSRKTRSNSGFFNDAIDRLLSIGWLEEVELKDIPHEPATIPQSTDYRRKEEKGMEGKKPSSRFRSPNAQEIMAYCEERKKLGKPPVDYLAFYDHYEANGWVQGRNKPVKDWKACVRTWERNNFSNKVSNFNRQNQIRPPLQDLS